jgi:hypothetical protein
MSNTEGDFQSEANPIAKATARSSATAVVLDDRILPEVHWVAGVVVLVLVTAAFILYFFPDKTADLFAWTIHPTMSALCMGAGYAAGAYYFARVFVGPKWHWVGTYFPAIATFTTILGVATIVYWDKFNHGTLPFYAWVFLYWTTPILLPILWLRNRRTDPGSPDPGDVLVSRPVRIVTGIAGAGLLTLVVLFILLPDVMISVWPWALTPAVSLSIAGWLSAPGVCYVLLASETRWSAWRVILQHQLIAVGLILIAAVRAWGEFDTSKPSTWLFMGGMTLFLVAIAALLYVMDARRVTATS